MDRPEQVRPSWTGVLGAAAHPRTLRATRAEVRSSRARRSCVTDFVSEGCEVRAGHQVKCSS